MTERKTRQRRQKTTTKKDDGMSTVMDDLRKQAEEAQKDLKRGGIIRWDDLDDGNFIVFDILDGFDGEQEYFDKKRGYKMTFKKWFTPAYKLFDIDGNLIKADQVENRKDDSTFFGLPSKDKLIDKIQEALDEGMTTGYMTGHEYRNFTPKGQSEPIKYHHVTIEFCNDNGSYANILNDKEK